MIKFFRKIRQQLLTESKLGKYLLYAIGEIFLVVIGILLALQINNKNEERIQEKELNGLMKSISSAIGSDIRYLSLIKTARVNIGKHADSIFNAYIDKQKPSLAFIDYAYISNSFDELTTAIYYQPNTSSFEALKNSIYLSKLQGTDIELLLHTYYSAAERIQKQEEEYNQMLKSDYQTWSNKFRNNGRALFLRYWEYMTEDPQEKFLEILNDENTIALLAKGFEEANMSILYEQQILLGEKYIEMVNKGEVNIDEETKIDFTGTLFTYAEVDFLNLLVNGKVPSGFALIYAQSGNEYFDGVKFEDDYTVLTYPENIFAWGSPYFSIKALNGRVTEMDFTKYKNVILEMKGEIGGEEFALMMKDKYDLHDGKESRVNLKVTNTWETYEVPIDQFETADKKIIETPLGFVFLGSKGVTIHVRSIQFK